MSVKMLLAAQSPGLLPAGAAVVLPERGAVSVAAVGASATWFIGVAKPRLSLPSALKTTVACFGFHAGGFNVRVCKRECALSETAHESQIRGGLLKQHKPSRASHFARSKDATRAFLVWSNGSRAGAAGSADRDATGGRWRPDR